MAPVDDFVFTISDNEDLPISDFESTDSELAPTKKRKRGDTEGGKFGGKAKKQKAQQTKQEKTKQHAHVEEEDDTSEDEGQGVKDDALDSDFEFDVGGVQGDGGTVEEFDGWGDEKPANGNKKGVDIDAIIARRAAKNAGLGGDANSTKENIQGSDGASGVDPEIEEQGSEESGYEDEDEQQGDGFPDFEEDELLAEDAFGAGAVSEDSDDEHDDQDQDADGDSSSSDNESVASPTAHPDDVASEAESEAESQTSTSDAEEAAKRKAFFAPESNTKPTVSGSSFNSFVDFHLSRPLMRALAALSFTAPTPIQARAIPVALEGHDVVGSAVTGSGKTAAFLLPILERLLFRQKKVPTTRVVVLMPTRELAVQCYNVATALARYTDITFAQVVGGFSLREQETILKKRPDVVIATPGRFIDHMRNSASFNVDSIEILVLDEADRMLETGFADELDEILKTLPKRRQTMLFSATMTDTVDKLVRVGMTRPVRLSVDAKRTTTAGLIQEFVRLRPGREQMRLATLCVLCTKFFHERTIIFFRQKKDAHRVRIVFGLLGVKAGELHGSMTQEQRISAVNGFRDGKTTHLLATDLASRGLDIKNVMTVVNYEAPQSHEIYLHRVGRTARAGKTGQACTIAAEPDRKVVKQAVKAGRSQGAKIVSRTLELEEVDAMNVRIEGFADDIEEILQEEKEEKQLSQAEMQITRGQNLVTHEKEIKGRPKRTWFESEKEKREAKKRGGEELNKVLGVRGEKKKLSNKDKKKLDAHRDRVEGRGGKKKGKGDEDKAVKERRQNKRVKKMKKGKK